MGKKWKAATKSFPDQKLQFVSNRICPWSVMCFSRLKKDVRVSICLFNRHLVCLQLLCRVLTLFPRICIGLLKGIRQFHKREIYFCGLLGFKLSFNMFVCTTSRQCPFSPIFIKYFRSFNLCYQQSPTPHQSAVHFSWQPRKNTTSWRIWCWTHW